MRRTPSSSPSARPARGSRAVTRLAALLTVAAAALGLAATALAANPHFESASDSFDTPTVNAPGDITWDASVVVPFEVAGLGKSTGLAATLTADSDVTITSSNRGDVVLDIVQHGTGNDLTLTGLGAGSRGTIDQEPSTATLTSGRNGQLTGSLTLPVTVDAAVTGGDECVKVSWTSVRLTVGTLTTSLPDLSAQYDSSGSACA